MPIKKLPQITAWSFSRVHKHRKCPLSCALANGVGRAKVKEPEGQAIVRGKRVEAEAMAYIFAPPKEKPALPKDCERFPDEMKGLRKIARIVQRNLKLAFDRNWNVLKDYFDPQTWFRYEWDLFWIEPLTAKSRKSRIHTVDLKTGQIYEEKVEQIELGNCVALGLPDGIVSNHPETSFAEMFYLDQGEIRDRGMVITDLEKERKRWEEFAAPLLSETSWQPKPGNHCRFCFFRKDNKKDGGGQCPY